MLVATRFGADADTAAASGASFEPNFMVLDRSTGTWLSVLVPSPSCPEAFAPQHWTCRLGTIAQVVGSLPAAMANVPDDRPVTAVGVSRWVVVPSPTSPALFNPQHFAAPLVSSAQV